MYVCMYVCMHVCMSDDRDSIPDREADFSSSPHQNRI